MAPSTRPPTNWLQQVWDSAATMASRGVPLAEITATAVDNAGPQLQQDVLAEVPRHGRTFWLSMAKSLAWGVAAEVSLLFIGSLSPQPLPVMKVIICLTVLAWAIAFGIMAANQRVAERRRWAGNAKRAAVHRMAQDAAGRVWAAQLGSRWLPLGPPVSVRRSDGGTDASLATAWLRRLGIGAEAATATISDGTEAGLSAALRSTRGRPPVLFVPEPGHYADRARSIADRAGVALFILGAADLIAMSPVASSMLAALRDPTSEAGPAAALAQGWQHGAAGRSRSRSQSERSEHPLWAG